MLTTINWLCFLAGFLIGAVAMACFLIDDVSRHWPRPNEHEEPRQPAREKDPADWWKEE